VTTTLPSRQPPAPAAEPTTTRPAPVSPRAVGGHRGGVPSGRALIGGLLVAVAALGIFAAYQAARGGPSTQFVVAAGDIAPGSRLAPDQLRLEPIELPEEVAAGAFTDVDDLIGDVALAAVAAGELVQASAIADAPADGSSGYTMSFAIDADRAVGGDLRPGERVAILVTYIGGQTAETRTVVDDATVLQFERADEGALSGALGETVLTVQIPAGADPLALAHAARVGEITVVRAGAGGEQVDLGDSFQPEPPGSGAGDDEG
jgi:Flp pilus assembly protein CpaB